MVAFGPSPVLMRRDNLVVSRSNYLQYGHACRETLHIFAQFHGELLCVDAPLVDGIRGGRDLKLARLKCLDLHNHNVEFLLRRRQPCGQGGWLLPSKARLWWSGRWWRWAGIWGLLRMKPVGWLGGR